jgi:hypothetical protein
MRRISATYVCPISSLPLKYGIISLDQKSCVTGVTDNEGIPVEISSLEYYNGLLVPGFIPVNFIKKHAENSRNTDRLNFERGIRVSIDIAEIPAGNSTGTKILLRNFISKGDSCKTQDLVSPELVEESKVKMYSWNKISEKNTQNELIARLNNDILVNYKTYKDLPVWYLVSPETIELIEKRKLTAFFRENLSRIVFSWSDDKPKELWALLRYFIDPSAGLNLTEVLKPLTINPAKMTGLSDVAGQIKTGFQPGINLVEGIDFKEMLPVWEKIRIRRLA